MTQAGQALRCFQVLNRQRFKKLRTDEIIRGGEAILNHLGMDYEISVKLVGERSVAAANLQFLNHPGTTDIITFDYGSSSQRLVGDLLISVSDAWRQAARFKTTGEVELLRYLIHGFLHLMGYDDRTASLRRKMKNREDRLTRQFRGWAPRFVAVHKTASRTQG